MFNSSFLEGTSQVAMLHEDHPLAFEHFISWIYRDAVELVMRTNGEVHNRSMEMCVRLFSFAEKYGITKLADNTMDALMNLLKDKDWFLLPKTMNLGYQNTRPKSKLRLLVLRAVVFAILDCEEFQGKKNWSNDKLIVIVKEHNDPLSDSFTLMRGLSGKEMKIQDMHHPAYHPHGKDENCPYKENRTESGSRGNGR